MCQSFFIFAPLDAGVQNFAYRKLNCLKMFGMHTPIYIFGKRKSIVLIL